MQKIKLTIFIFVTTILSALAGNTFDQPTNQQLVVDNAQVFSLNEKAMLTQKLNQFSNETSTQILVYTTNDLEGYEVADFAQRLGEGWKIGQKGFDNGIVIVFKPKTSTPGQITIQTGYGIEPLIPDATANQIIQNEMIPFFKQGKIAEGINAGIDVCLSLTKGEFTAKQYKPKQASSGGAVIILIVFLITFFSIFGRSRRSRYYSAGSRSNLPLWAALFMMGSGTSRGSGYSNFSSGSGSFGGFGGGSSFGGFGGGSFGGGGASGSW